MRLAMAISPSRVSSSTVPISRMYMRTGSVVRPPEQGGVVSIPSRDGSEEARVAVLPFVPERKAVEILDRNISRLHVLVQDMLESARLQSGKLRLSVRPTDLAHLVHTGRPLRPEQEATESVPPQLLGPPAAGAAS